MKISPIGTKEGSREGLRIDPRHYIPFMCRGDERLIVLWMNERLLESYKVCVGLIFLGAGVYGYTMGMWHGPEMGFYVAMKLPLLMVFTLIVNALLNGMLSLVLGSGISMRQSLSFLLVAFATTSLILGALSPLMFFMAWNAPSPSIEQGLKWHSVSLLVHISIIAYAGVTAHRVLLGEVRKFALSAQMGTVTFLVWLCTNLFVGAQLSWLMRPFFGSPGLDIQFLRDQPFRGTFYEAVWNALKNILY